MSPERKRELAWALYDWANSAFATTVMAGFFPIFFKQYWSAGQSATESTLHLGVANSAASIAIAVVAPALGAIADAGNARKRFLAVFAALGVIATGALWFVTKGDWVSAAVLFTLGSAGFMGGNVFYDSLLVSVARDERRDFVSALGYSLGYLGGGLLFALNVAMVLAPQRFGLASSAVAVRVAFVSVALWWGLFSLPLFLGVREPHRRLGSRGALAAVRGGFAQLVDTFREIQKLRVVAVFLLAYWLYIDGVNTVIRMAVDYGMAIGLESNDLIVALLITQFVGFPAAIVFGRAGREARREDRHRDRRGRLRGVTVWAAFMHHAWEFFALAVVIGLVQGGVQALSRSLYARLIPPDRASEFFGFYNMLGKFAAVLGPLIVGFTGELSGSPRLGILALLVLFVAGGVLLSRVDVQAGARAATGAG